MAKVSFKVRKEDLGRIREVSFEAQKGLDFFVQEAMHYYLFLENYLARQYAYGFYKNELVMQATSVYGLLYPLKQEVAYPQMSCVLTYSNEFAQKVKEIAHVTSMRIEDILASAIHVYGETIYFARKGYRPVLKGEKPILINCELTRFFFPEK